MRKAMFLLAAACLLLASCSNNINVFLPRGPEGADGQSAYDQWVEMVAEGLEDPHNPPDLWPKDETDVHDFYRYLSGRDGLDGNSGGGNPGGGGDGNDGNDGKSAYDLWVEDVTDADGLDNHHTPAVGDVWPPDETSLGDFWRYLTGDDSSSSSVITEPGTNGPNITPIAGKPNVIALYTDQAHSEYVNVETGAVTYQVWKDDQTKAAAGVSVSGLRGISGKTYTTNADGKITVPAADLPTSGDTAARFGSVMVDGAASAINTYVPQRVETRLVIGYGSGANLTPSLGSTDTQAALSGGAYMIVPVKAQRLMTSEGAWEDIPAWITDVDRNVRAYDAQMVTRAAGDLVAPDRTKPIPIRGTNAQDLKTGATVSVRRPTVKADWLMPQAEQVANYYMNVPGTTPEVFTMALDETKQFYGQYPHAEAVIAIVPACLHPLPIDIVMENLGSGTFKWISTSFNTSVLDQTRFATKYELLGGDGVTVPFLYNPGEAAINTKCFSLGFKKASTEVGDGKGSTFADPEYTVNENVPLDSSVYFFATSSQVVGPGNDVPIGTFMLDTVSGKYIIRATAPFEFPDITITMQ